MSLSFIKIRVVILGVVSMVILTVTTVVILSVVSMHQLKQGHFVQAQTAAHRALWIVKPLSTLTWHQVHEFEAWKHGLLLIDQFPPILTNLSQVVAHSLESDASAPLTLQTQLEQLNTTLQQLHFHIQASKIISRFAQANTIDSVAELTNDITGISNQLLTGQHTYLVLLQNNRELRATGGFIGSYAEVSLDEGQLGSISIQDMYEPDGQFQGFVTAPPGVAEYLSSGRGLRLPDANWHPDFPSSSQQILRFFALGKKQNVEGIVAINLSLVESMLKVIGDVYLPDYQTTVTAENLAEVARSDRDSFFPGSQQKPQFLTHLFTQVKLRLASLSPTQQRELINILLTGLKNKNLLIYSNNTTIQAVANKYEVDGSMKLSSTNQPVDRYLYLVESNVGINKANTTISREVKVELSDYRTVISIDFANRNPVSSGLNYANYQRVLLDPATQVHQITYGSQVLTDWDEAIISNAKGDQFKQVGFLAPLVVGQNTTLSIELTHQQPLSSSPYIYIQKQPGLPSTPYTVLFPDQSFSVLLEKDTVIPVIQ